ncbi:MAG: hypothetical protein R3E32_01680 [Chitinophagales bacterium]
MKKLTYLLAILSFVCFLNINAQAQTPEKKGFDKSRLFTGGSIGLSFSNNYSFVEVSPIIGYYFTDKFSAGLGPSYQYHKFGFLDYSFNIIGANAFARYDILDNFFLHGEYGVFSYKDDSDNSRQSFSMLPIGGGYRQFMGRTSIYAMALYDMFYAKNKDNQNLFYFVGNGLRTNTGWIFRVGVNFGF